MQAIHVAQFGGPEVLVPAAVADPVAGPGQAIIDVTAADVLVLDAMIRSGLATEFFPLRLPYVPGNGVSGTVVCVGRARMRAGSAAASSPTPAEMADRAAVTRSRRP